MVSDWANTSNGFDQNDCVQGVKFNNVQLTNFMVLFYGRHMVHVWCVLNDKYFCSGPREPGDRTLKEWIGPGKIISDLLFVIHTNICMQHLIGNETKNVLGNFAIYITNPVDCFKLA